MTGATQKSGRCMCGAVRFTATGALDAYRACACDMCRRLTGSKFYSVWVRRSSVEIEGADHIRTHQSSDWAERGFCGTCGSVLWYGPTDGRDAMGLSLGLFDDTDAMTFVEHFYADKDICATVARTAETQMTGAETEAHFGHGA